MELECKLYGVYCKHFGKVGRALKRAHCNIWKTSMPNAGTILRMRPANERRRHNITSSLIGWSHPQADPCHWQWLQMLFSVTKMQRMLTVWLNICNWYGLACMFTFEYLFEIIWLINAWRFPFHSPCSVLSISRGHAVPNIWITFERMEKAGQR